MGILGAERCFRPEEGATLRPGMPRGLFFFPYPQPRADLVWKGVLLWVKKLLFTSRLLGVTGIPESSWGMGGNRGGNAWITRTILLVKPTPSLPSHSCPPLPQPLAPGSFSLEDSRGEQLVSEGLIRAQRPWLRARVREPRGPARCHLSGPFLPSLDSEITEGSSCLCPGWRGVGSCGFPLLDLAA